MSTLTVVYFLVFWIVTAPVLTFIHELGHAFPALLATDKGVVIDLGTPNTPSHIASLGRLQVKFRLGSTMFGFVHAHVSEMSRVQKAIFYFGGPTASIGVAAATGIAVYGFGDQIGYLKSPLASACYAAILQVLLTVIPIRYPKWWGSYAGMESDGLRLVKLLGVRRATAPGASEG